MPDKTPADLIAEHNSLDDWLKAESKRFQDHCAPQRQRLQEIETTLHQLLLNQNGGKVDEKSSIKTGEGTAYLSRILTPTIVDKTQYLDWVLENWDAWGALLQIGAPNKDTLREYLDQNNGAGPPNVKIEWFVKCNIRRS